MCRSIWRVFLAAVFITAAGNVAAGKICGSPPEGKCYQVNSAGKFESYGEYLWQSKEIVMGRSVGGDIAVSLVQYLREGNIYKYKGYALSVTPGQLNLLDRKRFKSPVEKIKLPVRNSLPLCSPYVTKCFALERTNKDVYYGGKYNDGRLTRRDGYGLVLTNEGQIYVGYFRRGEPHGKGHLVFFSGEEYIGEFRDGKFNGYGVFYYASGKEYRGHWRDNRQHGEGSVYDERDALEWKGSWSAGKKLLSQLVIDRIRALQRLLINAGYLEGAPDGIPGTQTKSAMQRIVTELPSAHHGRLRALDWTNAADLKAASDTIQAYIAEPLGKCPVNGHVQSLCFIGT